MAGRRLFVGLPLPVALGESLLSQLEPLLGGDLRVYPARDLHLTLHFLGMRDEGEYDALERTISTALAECHAPSLCIDHCGVFPLHGPPRILWAGVSEAPGCEGRLAELFTALEDALVVPEMRGGSESRPHITIARVPAAGFPPEPADWLGASLEFSWAPSTAVLFESRPESPQARYLPQGLFELDPPSTPGGGVGPRQSPVEG